MFYLIRHAESVSNAGGKTINDKENHLSEKGFQQSVDLLQRIPGKPDLIVVSPYLRAQQTAKPLINKYPDVPVEIWNVQEFTFLDANRCDNTTHAERSTIRQEYLVQNDPDLIHGKGAESFNQMLQRVDELFDKLKSIDKNKFVIIFTHGHFMRAVLTRKDKQTVTFDDIFEGKIINNTDIVELLSKDKEDIMYWETVAKEAVDDAIGKLHAKGISSVHVDKRGIYEKSPEGVKTYI